MGGNRFFYDIGHKKSKEMRNNFDIMQDLLYMQELQPDDGYEVDFAVGTTFSLSMEGLISIPLALSNMGDPKSLTDQTAMYLMEGIRRARKKFVLFCNKGSILVPNNCQPIYSLLEDSVIEVANPSSPLANFHPKIWVLRQNPIEGNGESLIKLIVMSRNLTFSNDLDTALVIKGKISKKRSRNNKNKPLYDFLLELTNQYEHDGSRKEKIQNLAKDLLRVDDFDFERPLSSKLYEIYPYLSCSSFSSTSFNKSLIDKLKGNRILIISPFIDNDPSNGVLKTLTDETSEAYLVTRDNNITQEVIDMFSEVYAPNITLTDNDEQHNVNLHAKVYLVEHSNEILYLYLGSANATNSAFNRNSELTIGMRVNNLDFEAMMNELVLKDGLYIKVTEPISDFIEEKLKRQEADMEHVLRWAISSLRKAKVVNVKRKGYYTVKLEKQKSGKEAFLIKDCIKNYDIKIRPLQCNDSDWKSLFSNSLQWTLQLEELSMFYVIEVISHYNGNKHKRICKVLTEGLDKFVEQRNDKIVSSIVKAENIMEYIEMILSDFPEDTLETWNRRKHNKSDKPVCSISLWKNAAIYEQLLKTSYNAPSKLKILKDILQKLPDDKFDDEIKSVFKAFGITLKSKKK